LGKLVASTLNHQWHDFASIEARFAAGDHPFVPPTETDRHPAAAAARFLERSGDAEEMERLLVHDDAELLAEVIAEGDAFRGTIEAVEDTGTGRATRPVWTIRVTDPEVLPFDVGDGLCVVGCAGREVTIQELIDTEDGEVHVVLSVTSLVKRRPQEPHPHDLAPVDEALVGESVAFVKRSASGIAHMKSRNVWATDGPGAWLTHKRPGGRLATLPLGDSDVDDVPLVEAGS
jgi:hypothetical protein